MNVMAGLAGGSLAATAPLSQAGRTAPSQPEAIEEAQPFELHRGFVIAVKGTIGELST